ncbi:MAG: MG2 domain-containing protein [Verrucomicrobiota bacterium]
MKIISIFFTLALVAMNSGAQDINEFRGQRDKLMKSGMHKEALDFYREKLLAVSDPKSGEDLEKAVDALRELGAWSEFDALVEKAVETHQENAAVLARTGQEYHEVPHGGTFVAGEFVRDAQYQRSWGGRRHAAPDGGEPSTNARVNTEYRDKVRSLQLLCAALAKAGSDEYAAHIWDNLANSLRPDDSNAWLLQTLTPIDTLPEWNEPGPEGETEGAPWAGDKPVLYQIPESWEAAKSDGERLRFAYSEIGRLSAKRKDDAVLFWADFTRSQFGTQTLAGWQPTPEEAKGIMAVDTLADDECLAKTSDGVRRFKLPADQHFIALYQSVLPRKAQAGDNLAEVFLNRLQFDKAAETLKETIRIHGPGHDDRRKKLLNQITGNWGRFEQPEIVTAGNKPKIALVFRNGKVVTLTAYPVDIERLVADAINHLKSNPPKIDHEKIQIDNIAAGLLKNSGAKYLGNTAGEWRMDLKPQEKHRDTRSELELPIDHAGAWWVRAKMDDGNEFYTLAWIIDGVLANREVDGKMQWWLADAETGAPVPGAGVSFFGYHIDYRQDPKPKERRMDVRVKEFNATTDQDGKVLTTAGQLEGQHQWLAVARKEGRAAVVSGFDGFYFGFHQGDTFPQSGSYGISDRPLYKPGDTAHLKFLLRPVGYGALDESTWAKKSGTLVIHDGRGQEFAKFENLITDELGAVGHDFVIPKNAVLGNWNATFEIPNQLTAAVSLRVEEYRKPEYEVKVEAPEKPIMLGEKFTATVKANYFHGAPVRHAGVEVTVKRSVPDVRPFPIWRWDWLYGTGAWWLGTDASWHPGWNRWGCIPPHPPWWQRRHWTPDEVILRKTVAIDNDGTAKVEIDTAPAKQMHGDVDSTYTIEARVTDASRREERGTRSVIAARKPFEVIVWTDRGYTRPGDAVEATISALTPSGEPVKQAKGKLTIYQLVKEAGGKIGEKEIKSWEIVTNDEGRVSQKFQAPATGQYRLAATLALDGKESEGATILNVFGDKADTDTWNFGPLELVPDKSEYKSGETVRLRVNSDRKDAEVWLFLRVKNQSAAAAKRIRLDGKSLMVEIPLTAADQPNLFVEGVTVHDGKVHTAVRQILLPPESKAIEVTLEPAKTKVKPREESGLRVTMRDAEGKPVSGKFTLTIYDKALEAITGGSNVGPILTAFWDWKYAYQPSLRDSLPRWSGSLTKPDHEQMRQLGRFHASPVRSRLAGVAFGGGRGMSSGVAEMAMDASAVPASPMALAKAPAQDAVGGGEVPILVRKDFADLVKWAGEIQTDENGVVEVPITWPDNLTTWKARVWTVLPGTRVGEGTTEIITSKDLLVRMQMPRFLVERDEATFSAIVHNDHAVAKTVTVALELEGNFVEAANNEPRKIEIPAKGETRVDWKVTAKREGEATVRMKVDAGDDGDAMEKKIPIIVHGMLRQDAWSRVAGPEEGKAEITMEVPEKLRPEQTKLTVRFSPSVATAVVDAIPYLASYPHGCTEQTLNRFVPTVIAAKMLRDLGINLDDVRTKRNNLNPQELGDPSLRAEQWKRWKENPVFDSAKLDDMTRAGVERLTAMQNGDGGWGWFSGYGESSYPHTTAVVVHGLLVAKENGAAVPRNVIDSGVAWLTAHERKQIAALQLHDEREALRKAGKKIKDDKRYEKTYADSTDAFVRMILGEAGRDSEPMLAYLFRDRLELPVYARCLLGLELHRKSDSRRDEVIRQVSQFLKRDAENQTAYLDLPNKNYWWFWYGSEVETHAWFLKLLAAAKPKDAVTRDLVKYLVNNRKHGTYWNSTRDSAYAIEAIASYIKASGENDPEMDVRVTVDGSEVHAVKITKENLFDFNGTVTLAGADVKPGKHVVVLEKSGKGTLYANAYLEVFTLEDKLRAAGLEVKVNRKVWKLIEHDKETETVDSGGLVVKQQGERFKREPLADGATVKSGDRIEVELILESKNDYEYLIFSDKKAAGFEALDALSGYISGDGGFSVYREPRDKSVDFFIRVLPRGTHTIRYQLRAETPGVFKALPATAEAMYARELRGNSEDIKLGVE